MMSTPSIAMALLLVVATCGQQQRYTIATVYSNPQCTMVNATYKVPLNTCQAFPNFKNVSVVYECRKTNRYCATYKSYSSDRCSGQEAKRNALICNNCYEVQQEGMYTGSYEMLIGCETPQSLALKYNCSNSLCDDCSEVVQIPQYTCSKNRLTNHSWLVTSLSPCGFEAVATEFQNGQCDGNGITSAHPANTCVDGYAHSCN
jgi:hypothetical protein